MANIIISSGTSTITSGETITHPEVLNDGKLYIASGASAYSVVTRDGGQEYVLFGGYDQYAEVYPGGTLHVNTGSSFNPSIAGIVNAIGADIQYAQVCSGGTLALSGCVHQTSGLVSKGNVNGTMIYEGGVMTLEKFAVCSNTELKDGGTMLMSSGTEAHGVTMTDGYILIDSASADNVIMSGGSMLVRGNGALEPGLVENLTMSSGVVWIDAGGSVSGGQLYGGTLRVQSNGQLIDVNADSGATLFVEKGGVHCNGTVYGQETIASGGTASNVTFHPISTASINIEGSAIDCNLAGGSALITSGGVFTDGVISSGGILTIESGAMATIKQASGMSAAINGGTLTLNSGTADYALLEEGFINVSSGACIGSTDLAAGTMTVFAGGLADKVIFQFGTSPMNLYIMSNAVINTASIAPIYASVYVDSGAILHKAYFFGGSATVYGCVDYCGIISRGEVEIGSGGCVSSAALLDFAIFSVEDSASVSDMTISSGGTLLASGGSITNITISSGGVARFLGGTTGGMMISSGGKLTITENLKMSAGQITFDAGGIFDFNISTISMSSDVPLFGTKGGNGYDTFIANPKDAAYTLTVGDAQVEQTYVLASDASTFNSTITVMNASGESLGTLTVDGGATDIGGVKYTLALDDSVLSVKVGDSGGGGGGGAPDLTGDLDSEFHLTSGMFGSSVNVIEGGYLNVESGGQLTTATVNSQGELAVSSGATATEIEVNRGGWLYVYSGGVAKQVTENGGYVYCEKENDPNVTFVTNTFTGLVLSNNEGATVHSGTTAAATVLKDGGNLNVFKGGSAVNTDVGLGGDLWIDSGGTATGIVENGGAVRVNGGHVEYVENTFTGLELSTNATVHSRTTAANTTIVSGGAMDVYNGTANDTVVNSRGILFVSKGTAAGVTVNKGGSMTIYDGTVTGIVENGGNIWFASSATIEFVENTFSGVVLDKEDSATVHSMTKALDTVVNPGGILTVYSGGTATGIKENGGYVVGYGSVTMSFVENTFSGLVLDYADRKFYATVHSATTAINTTVGSNCIFYVSGGVASNTAVDSTGRLRVSSGGRAIGVTVGSGGNVEIGSGGKLAGRIDLEDGAIVSGREGSVIDFDLRLTTEGAEALVSDLSLITGSVKYTLTVDGTQENGTYNLANNAAGFDESITIQNATGEDYGSISCGNTLNVDGVDYTLNKIAGYLTLMIDGATPPTPTGTAKSDIDGNGISDVMFVWTGEHGEGNYQHGYWMNGTNEWQSAGSGHPAEWENLGCYDMTGDGKADSVLVGNVEIEGRKGAYIGYYADAIDAIDGSTWVNIDYLNNEANVTWINKIGNLTGGSANSIVWYAPELYTLGAWTDGTSNWVTMTGSFGGNDWTLVGCGDFDGDGKDSVVMSGANGTYFYAADLDGTVTSLGSANWSGWTVRAIGDFLGDGKDDLVLFHQELGSMVMLADGNLDSFTSIGQLDAQDWFVVGAGDYNADAKDDLLVRQYSTGMLGYYSGGDVANGWVELGRGVSMEWTVIA